ncbi:MAG: electron transfer flavoprotein subunit alpha/FixB family protein [Flammeovirgaceae bacterium]|nr:electron transfer flavoprotein subunit alpha/FixB family protein [Flammeovirgaceae bacterium]
MSKQIFVITEHLRGKIDDVTYEMLGKGKELAAASGGELVAVLLGHNQKELANEFGAASKVIYADHEKLADFNPWMYAKIVSEIVAQQKPRVVLTAYSSMGIEVAPAVSVSQGISLTAYVSDLSIQDLKVSVVSQIYGGKMNIEAVDENESMIACVLPGSFPADAGKATGSPAVEDFAVSGLDESKIQFKKLIAPDKSDVDITQSEILVSVGRGIQSNDNLPMVEELATKLGGAVSCSRPIVDSKWMPKTRQVGKSGLKVKPKCYLALGISGAPEHIEGMKEADLVIAVNTDPKAPIFDYAHYGVVGDLFDIIPALSAKL